MLGKHCDKCDVPSAVDTLYRYEEQILCWDCLEDTLISEGMIDKSERVLYQVGDYYGSDDDLETVIEHVMEYLDIEEVD